MSTVIDHLERHLGVIKRGWQTDERGRRMPFQVVEFSSGPWTGTAVFATLGVNRHDLHSRNSGKRLRHELVMITNASWAAGTAPALLQRTGLTCLENDHGLLRGDTIDCDGPFLEGSSLTWLYVASPAYLPDDFASCIDAGETVIFAWVVPISEREADFVGRAGWAAFEQLLVEADPDLTDLLRPEVCS